MMFCFHGRYLDVKEFTGMRQTRRHENWDWLGPATAVAKVLNKKNSLSRWKAQRHHDAEPREKGSHVHRLPTRVSSTRKCGQKPEGMQEFKLQSEGLPCRSGVLE